MGWIQNLCSVYDQNLEEIKAETKGLLPIGYIEQAAQLEVWIDQGCFEYARVLPKSESMTRIPCTIESSSRSGKNPAPHPLFDKLKYNIREQLYLKEGTMPNNFAVTLHDGEQKQKAMRAFRKNYKLDFIEIDDVDEWDEHKVEAKIVENIKRFIMALGADFSYMGNQYRLIVDDKEYFIDLLFYNRRLRCLVAIELKWTEFLPEYVGKMNFYLSALDDLVRLPNENPSIGIILCRGQKQRTVEYALRDTRKPMGVATYRAANELPEEYGEVLGGLEGLKELM